jgi:GT2 family glycosyltransferase
MKDLSIIIVSYNTKNITKKCIDTIIRSLNYEKAIKPEIIVVDNGSTDGTVEMLKKVQSLRRFSRSPTSPDDTSGSVGQKSNISFKIISCDKNLGYAKANNLAVKNAEGKYLLFLNSDIEVIEDAVPKLYDFFKNNENHFQFVGGKLLNKDLSPQPSCGPFYSLPVVFAALFLRGDYWGLTRWSPNEIKEVDWVSGACILTKKDFFNNVGGFDENIFMYMDEIDFLYRAKKIGFKVGFYHKDKFIHLGSASSQGRTKPILQLYRGFLYFYKKHRSTLEIKILKFMLKFKACIAVLIGKIFKNEYLIKTYEQAFEIVKNFR